jgi:hypothetical protein
MMKTPLSFSKWRYRSNPATDFAQRGIKVEGSIWVKVEGIMVLVHVSESTGINIAVHLTTLSHTNIMPFHEITLNDGRKIPQIGFGSWKIPKDVCSGQVDQAIDVGFDHIDTAQGTLIISCLTYAILQS